MDSAKVPTPLQQQSDNLFCDVCNLYFKSQQLVNVHYRTGWHKIGARELAKCLFGYLPQNDVTCLDEIYNDPKRKGSFIGLQYLKEAQSLPKKLSFSCRLCGVTCSTIFQHVLSMNHRKKYIQKHFYFLFEDIDSLSLNVIAKIAEIIEGVEGLQKVKMAMKTPVEHTVFSEYPSKETLDRIVEQLQIHSIDFKNPSGINERNGKRLLRFKPLAVFKRSKSELPSQNEGKPIVSLSRPVPVPFSVSHTTVGNEINENHDLRATNHAATSYVPTVNNDMACKPIPTLCSSNKITWPQVEKQVPSWQPAESFNQNEEYGHSYYSDQSSYEFANKSSYGQAKSVSDGRQTYAVKGQTRGQETGHPAAKQLHNFEMMDGLVSSPKRPSGQCSTEASRKQDTPSRYSYNSVDIKELTSKSYLPSGTMSVLNKEPSSAMSPRDIYHSEGLPATTSTSSCAQTSQSTNASMPVKTANVLSPHTIKILQGRDPTSVKSILKRLSEYCPELQQVNISLLVDVLFETGALSWVPV